jgi:mutator family transposase
MEEIMREELELFVGAAWGECTPQRKGYRNGFYRRDLATSSGRIGATRFAEMSESSGMASKEVETLDN